MHSQPGGEISNKILHILRTLISQPPALCCCSTGETVRRIDWMPQVFRLRDFHVQFLLFTCKMWVCLHNSGCLAHRQFADVCIHHRFYPNLGQWVLLHLPCVSDDLLLTLSSSGQACLRRCEMVWGNDNDKKSRTVRLAAWYKPHGCLRCASMPVCRQRLFMELMTKNNLSLPLFTD